MWVVKLLMSELVAERERHEEEDVRLRFVVFPSFFTMSNSGEIRSGTGMWAWPCRACNLK